MTLVVTHANGFLGCFTRGDDGTMRQRALIDTGPDAPTAVDLAELGERLAREYGWTLAPALPEPVKREPLPPALSAAKKRQVEKEAAAERKRRYDATDPPTGERCALIKQYLQAHPNSTAIEVIAGLGYDTNRERISRWHHQFGLLVKAKQITMQIRANQPGSGKPNEYRIVEQTPVAEPAPVVASD